MEKNLQEPPWSEWHPSRNPELRLEEVTQGSGRKVWWVCRLGHEWQATIASRARAFNGCPFCSGRKILSGFNDLATIHPQIAAEWFSANPKPASESPPHSSKKAWWVCKGGHKWEATIASRTRMGRGCPYCSRQRVLPGENDLATEHPLIAAEWSAARNGSLTPADVFAGSEKKVWWICPLGHEYKAMIGNRTTHGTGCRVCSGKEVLPGFNDLASQVPELLPEWHPRNTLSPEQVHALSNTPMWWRCSAGHEWRRSPSARVALGRGCAVCAGQQIIPGENDLATLKPEVAVRWHPTRNGPLKPTEVSPGTHRKVWWQCVEGHSYFSTVANRSTVGCPGCGKGGYDPTSNGYLYLLRKEELDLQQFGISNKPEARLKTHRANGWEVLDVVGPADGYWVLETETMLSRYFKDKGLRLPADYGDKFDGFSESWKSMTLSYLKISEMLSDLRSWEMDQLGIQVP